jgi:hypothetical protein
LNARTSVVLLCIAVVAFAPLLGVGGDLCAVLAPLWLGGPDGRVVIVQREPLRSVEQLLPLFSPCASRAPPPLVAAA